MVEKNGGNCLGEFGGAALAEKTFRFNGLRAVGANPVPIVLASSFPEPLASGN
jgi:hypothetical protein